MLAMFRCLPLLGCFALVVRGFPIPNPGQRLPSMLSIRSEEELGRYSKKWKITPVQMCTLMGHQMTIAQPLLDIRHPLVRNLPSISEMAMSDAVMICEKVLEDEKNNQLIKVTTITEESMFEMDVPVDFLLDGGPTDIVSDLETAVSFSVEEIMEAVEQNEEALMDKMLEINTESAEIMDDNMSKTTTPPPAATTPASETTPQVTSPSPTLAEKIGRVHSY